MKFGELAKHKAGQIIVILPIEMLHLPSGFRDMELAIDIPAFDIYPFGRTDCSLTVYKFGKSILEAACLRFNINDEVELLPSDEFIKAKKVRDDLHSLHREIYSGGYVNLGADPEIFVERPTGEVLPAFEFLPHKKDAGGRPYWDGFQAEFNTNPNTCIAYHTDSVQFQLKELHAKAKKAGGNLSFKSLMEIPPQLIQYGKDEHVEFGCMPSFNAYKMKGTIVNGRDTNLRCAGGHIHFGPDVKKSEKDYINAVKAMDAIVGVACVSLFAGYDDPRRRVMYGLAGEYRLPPHGLEYRTLSNAWMMHPILAHMTFDLARAAFWLGIKDLLNKYWKYDEKEVVRIINECDVAGARKMLEDNKEFLISLLSLKLNFNLELAEKVFNCWLGGADSFIVNPKDIVSNWAIEKTWHTHSSNSNACVDKARSTLMENKKVS